MTSFDVPTLTILHHGPTRMIKGVLTPVGRLLLSESVDEFVNL